MTPAPVDSQRPHITSLELISAGAIYHLLTGPAGPLDISQLVHVTFFLADSTGVPALLDSVRKPIQSLSFDGSGEALCLRSQIALRSTACRARRWIS
jgi:hypothetical protein